MTTMPNKTTVGVKKHLKDERNSFEEGQRRARHRTVLGMASAGPFLQ
jgi:hypothetical protein